MSIIGLPNKIIINVSAQKLCLWDALEEQCIKQYSVSTAVLGVGQQKNSFKTPLGLHYIRAKIGREAPMNAVFVGRRQTGEIYTPALRALAKDRDWILTRILWLCGLERGINRLGTCDTFSRYIYIHGCPSESIMGIPGSHGCIRMRNEDVIDLFDRVLIGTRVDILQ